MAKVLVTYFSRTGNTKKIAEAIHDSIGQDAVILPLDKVEDIGPYGLVFIGFPVQSHSVPYKAEVFLKKVPAGKKIALFSTHGSLPGMQLSRQALEYASILVAKAKLLGTYACRGKVSIQALEDLGRSPEHEAWADMAASASTHPDEHDIADAKAFAKWVLTMSTHGHY
jgi:flavodoxin